MVLWLLLCLPLAWGSPPLPDNVTSARGVDSWESFLTLARSNTQYVVRSSLKFWMRSFSESEISGDCGNAIMKFAMGIVKWKTWAVRSKLAKQISLNFLFLPNSKSYLVFYK